MKWLSAWENCIKTERNCGWNLVTPESAHHPWLSVSFIAWGEQGQRNVAYVFEPSCFTHKCSSPWRLLCATVIRNEDLGRLWRKLWLFSETVYSSLSSSSLPTSLCAPSVLGRKRLVFFFNNFDNLVFQNSRKDFLLGPGFRVPSCNLLFRRSFKLQFQGRGLGKQVTPSTSEVHSLPSSAIAVVCEQDWLRGLISSQASLAFFTGSQEGEMSSGVNWTFGSTFGCSIW